jgi:hypothetical protein
MTEISDAWKLCERLSVIQASVLIAGHDPTTVRKMNISDLESTVPHFFAAKTALLAAIDERQQFGKRVYVGSEDDYGDRLDLDESFVRVEELKTFLAEKGVSDGFFFPKEAKPADYLDSNHPRYAPKLAAAVRSWEALDEATTLAGKSPKKALEKWLRENAADFGLTSEEDGTANESAIEAIARISNWRPQGGAPSTPAETPNDVADIPKQPVLRIAPPSYAEPEPIDSVDECPF